MGSSSPPSSNQVYYDSSKGQYYTQSQPNPLGGLVPGFGNTFGTSGDSPGRNYIGSASPNLNATSPSSINITQPTTTPQPNPYQPNYGTLGANTGTASGIAGIITNLVNSGAFQNYQTNPYAPQGSNNPVNVPYGNQQQPMFNMGQVNPYGGSFGQWSPYGNTYGGFNQYGNGFGGWNPNNTTAGQTSNVAPPPNTTGPDALSQLNMMSGQTPPPNA